MTYFTERRGNLGGRGPQRIMAQLENGFPREYGLKLALVRLLQKEKGGKCQKLGQCNGCRRRCQIALKKHVPFCQIAFHLISQTGKKRQWICLKNLMEVMI